MSLNQTFRNSITQYLVPVLPFLVLFALLIISQFHSYLFFHTTVEIFVVIVAVGIFMFSWNTRKLSRNGYFLFLGIVYLSVGTIDLMHAFSYKGMHIFPGIGANLPTQLWLEERYLLAFSLVLAPLFIGRKINESIVLGVYAAITAFLLLAVFYLKIFPDSYKEGIGLTPFKIYSEYLISALFLISAVILGIFREKFDGRVFVLLFLSFIINIVSELLFTLYIGVYDIFNMLGHLGELLSYYLVYKAIIEVGLTKPYNLMFLELKQADKQKDEFLSIASHELKTPITTIKGYAQILNGYLSKNKDSKSLVYVSKLELQIDRLGDLIKELLDVSRIQSRKLELNKERFNLTDLVKDVVEDMQYANKSHKIIVMGEVKKQIMADKHRISQVLINFISNAIIYSPKADKVIVKVFFDHKSVGVSVSDFGIGIKGSHLNKVFERFYQDKNRIRVSNGGLGLGLYISKEIIKKHNGKIWARSEKGKGSTFSFNIPLDGKTL